MPIYEYHCRSCGHEFEALVRGSDTPACPSCKGADIERLLSMFAVSSHETRQASLKRAKVHYSKEAKERAVGEMDAIRHHDHDSVSEVPNPKRPKR